MNPIPIIAALCLPLALAAAPVQAQAPAKGKPAVAAPAAPASFKETKLAAIDAWLAANKTSSERAEALKEAATLAFDLGIWAKSKSYAETFLAEFPKDEEASELQLVVCRSLANLPGSEAEARKGFEKVIADAGEDANVAVQAALELADFLAISGDLDGAKKTLDGVKQKFNEEEGLADFLDGKVKDFEQYGKPPKAPIDVAGLDGKPIRLADLKGKVVLIDFWATWCPPCRAEMPNVIATYKKLHPQGFEIVGISLDQDKEKLTEFLAAHDMPWPQFFDGKGGDNSIAHAYAVESIPQTYLLDKEGNVRGVGLRGAVLGSTVERLLRSK